ncbi:uncharacterized protein CDAR_596991 [Caerostris darwini]|uniref:Uncharacterized protein n=1 Tax=Caerostris darwini TaxID=1538125 RepID=A0AAV4U2L2_9ARAC|nr:uncharacterized protein CDAR_596991 [Caerostris darwini]
MQHWGKEFSQLNSHECYFVTTTLRGGRKDLALSDLYGAFMMLVYGLIIAIVAGCCEKVWRKLQKRSNNKRTLRKGQSNIFSIRGVVMFVVE